MSSVSDPQQPMGEGHAGPSRILDLFRSNREKQPPARRDVIVVTNPSAGQDQPFLKLLNSVFKTANLTWDVRLTMQEGDGKLLAEEAVARGAKVVVAFGGDGTVVDVASGLIGTKVPLGILPGGTSNMMSRAFNIPQDLESAAALIASHYSGQAYPVYIGKANDHYFQQLIGIGTQAQMVEGADRSAKDRLGFFAYILAGLRALSNPQNARYRIELDNGQVVEEEGVTCLVAKVGNLGIPSLEQAPTTADPDAPLLDIVIVRQANLPALLSLAGTVISGNEDAQNMLHWQARRVRVSSTPQQTIQADGEMIGTTPITVEILHPPVRLIVPAGTLEKKQEMKSAKPG